MKRLFLFLFCGLLSVTGCKKDERTGRAGTLTWTLSTDGTLTINGKGEIPDYQVLPTEFLPQWYAYRNDIFNVVIDDNVRKIGNYAFFRCENLTSMTIGNSISAIGIRAFSGCSSLMSVIIPNSVLTIGDDAFSGCKNLRTFTMGDSVTDIGNAAFYQCKNLMSAIIPNSVTTIGSEAFFSCSSLPSVVIPNSVTNIGESAFYFCENLTSVTIGKSVTVIGNDTFRNCSSLTEIINYQTIPQVIDEWVFGGLDKLSCTLQVPVGSIEAYSTAEGWKNFRNIEAIKL